MRLLVDEARTKDLKVGLSSHFAWNREFYPKWDPTFDTNDPEFEDLYGKAVLLLPKIKCSGRGHESQKLKSSARTRYLVHYGQAALRASVNARFSLRLSFFSASR